MRINKNLFVILANFLVLFLGGIIFSSIKQEAKTFTEIPIYSWGGDTGERNYLDESFQNAKFWFSVETGSMKRGIYKIHVNYDTDETSSVLKFLSDGGESWIKAEWRTLDASYQEFEQEIWLEKGLSNSNISIDRSNVGYLKVNSITIYRCNLRSFTYEMLKLLLVLAVIDIIYISFCYRKKWQSEYAIVLGLICVFAVSSIGIFTDSIVQGHDIWFHLARIEGIKDGLMSGAFPVKIQPTWLNGYGYAVSVMYGDLFLYFPAILRILGMPLQDTYMCYQLTVNLFTVLISYFCFYRISKDKYIGLLGTAIYCTSTYRMCNMYVRAALGEYSAMTFFPLVILGVWELFTSGGEDKTSNHSWIWLTLGFTGLIQTHVLSCEMVGIFILITFIALIKKILNKQVILLLCKTGVAVLLINIWFLVPFFDYMREDFKVFADNSIVTIQQLGISLYQLFSVVTVENGSKLYMKSDPQELSLFSIGMASMLILIITVMVMAKKCSWKEKQKEIIWGCICLLGLACLMTTRYFPWDALSIINPMFNKLIATIQFGIRFMGIAMALAALLSCLVFMKLKEWIVQEKMKLLVALLCIISAYQCLEYTDMCVRQKDHMIAYDGTYIKWEDAVSGKEYLYENTSSLEFSSNQDVDSNVSLGAYEKEYNRVEVSCKADEEGYIEVPLYYYPYYNATDHVTDANLNIIQGNNDKLRVEIPKGYEGTISILSFRKLQLKNE